MRISYLIVPVIQYNSNLVGSGLVYMMITVSILGKHAAFWELPLDEGYVN